MQYSSYRPNLPPPTEYRIAVLEGRIAHLEEMINHLTTQVAHLAQPVQPPRAPACALSVAENKLVGSIPPMDSTNPIAALINFCKHVLHDEVRIVCEQASPNDDYLARVFFRGVEMGYAYDRKKASARVDAAKRAIIFLHEHPQFVLEHA